MLLMINFLELGVASRQHTVILPRTCHDLEMSLSERHIRGMAGERLGNGMAFVNQMGKTQS
jgi:hypothetical protein